MSVFTVSEDVYGIQLDDDETIATYLIAGDEPVLIETGTANGVSHIMDGLTEVGIEPTELQHAVIGHYHLDHAGGAPALQEAAPNATFYLHEAMAEWLTDPDQFEALVSSSAEALGTSFESMGAPETALSRDRLEIVTDDGREVDIGSTTLDLLHTPGHSPDHLSVMLPDAGVLFANEAIGRYYPRADTFHPPVTVPSFDIEATRTSIDRLAALEPDIVTLSHYGTRSDPEILFETAHEQLTRFTERVPALYDECDEDLDQTVDAVRRELIDLEDSYSETVASTQADVCTRGVLRSVDIL